MSQSFKLPDLGEGIHEGEVQSVLVKVGDRVEEGQPILEIETDKAGVEIPSPFTGTVEEIRVQPNDVVKVGSVLIVFGSGQPEELQARSQSMGDAAAATGAEAPPAIASKAPPLEAQLPPGRNGGPVPASPATRRLARELGVDLRQVPGSGPAGLVTAEDVRSYATGGTPAGATRQPAATAPSPAPSPPEAPAEPAPSLPLAAEAPPLPDFGKWGAVERVPLRSVRRATAAHMALAWAQIPHVNHQEVADITRLDSFRRQHAAEIEAMGGKLTLTVFVLKAVVAALKAHPRFNASLDVGAQEIVLKHYFHLGVAVDSERGLIVPVLRDVNQKSIAELAVELKKLAERTRSGETSLEELQGGTFTITNIGALGGTGFAPIINYPQVAILGMGRASLQPVVMGTEEQYEIVPRLMMPLILAFDHRVLDGADAARFMKMVKAQLEDPDQLWLKM